MIGTTRDAQNHRHDVILKPDGTLETDFKYGHRHTISVDTTGGKTKYTVSPPVDLLVARVPILGHLRFLDRNGSAQEKGINVGHEWGYRGFVDGNTKSAAIWTFDNVDENKLFSPSTPADKRGLPLEMTIRVFRTWKGNIEKGITGKLFFRNPDTQLASDPIIITAKEFAVDRRFVDRKMRKAGAADRRSTDRSVQRPGFQRSARNRDAVPGTRPVIGGRGAPICTFAATMRRSN